MENIKDFFLQDAAEENRQKKTNTQVEYSVVTISGPDFVLKRKTKKTESYLAILPSKKQLYIKDNSGNISELTAESMKKFCMDMEEEGFPLQLEGEKPTWIQTFYRGKVFADNLFGMLQDDKLLPLITKNMVYVDKVLKESHYYKQVPFQDFIFDNQKSFLMANNTSLAFLEFLFHELEKYYSREELKEAFSGKTQDENLSSIFSQMIRNSSMLKMYTMMTNEQKVTLTHNNPLLPKNVFELLMVCYGKEGVRQFLKNLIETPVCFSGQYKYRNGLDEFVNILFPGGTQKFSEICMEDNSMKGILQTFRRCGMIEYDMQSFFHYIFNESTVQGYADNMSNFLTTWRDTLKMEMDIYGKIAEKYPKNLATLHNQLSYKNRKLEEWKEIKNFQEKAEEMAQYEDKIGDYVFLAPKSPTDLIDEGTQQSNCVASYTSSICNGDCYIFFCRHKKTPGKSLITVEVCPSDDERLPWYLGQVKARFNHAPSENARAVVQKWFNKQFVQPYLDEKIA